MELATVTVTLETPTYGEVDSFNMPTVTYTSISVSGVLVGEPSTEDVTSVLNLYGKKVQYTLAIPKDDDNEWVNSKVVLPSPFAGEYRTVGYPIAGIESNIPLKWNKKVYLERVGENE